MNYTAIANAIKLQRDKLLDQKLISLQKFIDMIPKQKIDTIVNASCADLALYLNEGYTTSTELVRLFSYRSATIGKTLEAITQENFEQALNISQECDRIRKEKGWKNATLDSQVSNQFSPLFGIPFSVKDCFLMKDFSSTLGLLSKYQEKAEKDGQIITILKSAGLIPFVRSNVPPLLSAFNSDNVLWGSTKNPWNVERTAGGSSGGEAALIASGCSPLGIGSDIGGSLRNPADFCGICTIKPSSQRLTIMGHSSFSASIDGQTNIKCSFGPLAKKVQDLALFMKVMCSSQFYTPKTKDPYKKLISFDNKMYRQISQVKSKIRIGYFDSLQISPTTPASRRAVNLVVQLLKLKGYQLIPFKVPSPEQYIKIQMTEVFAEGGMKGHIELLKGQPLTKDYQAMIKISNLPESIHQIQQMGFSKLNPRMTVIMERAKKYSSHQYFKATTHLQTFKKEFYDIWAQLELDLIICPGFGQQAFLNGVQEPLGLFLPIYNSMWNILDYPAGSIPITLCKKQQQAYESQYHDSFQKFTIKNQIGAEGLPVGIQVVGLPFQQQKVLGLMKLIQDEVKFSTHHPYPM